MAAARSGSRRWPRKAARWVHSHLALWVVAATATDTALVALVSVLISLPGQSTTIISCLVGVLVGLLALSVAFPVAGHVLDKHDQAASHEQRRQERIDRLLAKPRSTGQFR